MANDYHAAFVFGRFVCKYRPACLAATPVEMLMPHRHLTPLHNTETRRSAPNCIAITSVVRQRFVPQCFTRLEDDIMHAVGADRATCTASHFRQLPRRLGHGRMKATQTRQFHCSDCKNNQKCPHSVCKCDSRTLFSCCLLAQAPQ